MGNSIFDTLATQDTQKIQHDQNVTQIGDVFDKLAANNGQPPDPNAPKGPTISATPQASDAPTFGYDWQSPQDRMTMPLAKVLMAAHDKLRDVESFTQEGKQEHPIQAKMGEIASRIEGFLFGNEEHPEAGIGTGKYGILTNPVTSAILPGSKGVPAAAEAIEGGVNAIKGAVSGIRAGGEEAPGLVKQVLKGKEVAQEPAQAAIQEATGTSKGASLLEGNKSIVDDKIKNLFGQERAAYAKQDKVAGFDIKALQEKLDNTEEQISNLTDTEEDVAKEAKLEKSRTALMDKIGDAEGKLKQAGIDPDEAKNIFKSRKAAEDFKKAIVQHSSSDGSTINVDGLLESAKKMRFNKYGDRLSQLMGSDAKADEFMHKLEAAQDLGEKAVTKQKIAKWAGAAVGLGAIGEAAHLAKGALQ